ncbi:GyrI-like domain-containing protein [Methanosphaera sp. WGK6]|uniref:GyrI-like domain-containing protein n=1 Tax=Methanosphaera sp. WGK6 TaxID=1561964 RepID=UPI001F51F9C5|nr:GyrI-like domain-containing protein [Methanosphaera sp. WGK6]
MIEVIEKKIPDQKVAYVPHIDSFSKLPEFIKEVGDLIAENKFEAIGFPYGSYDNDLEEHAETDQIFEVGMPIKDFYNDGKPAGRIGKLGLKEVAEHTVLAARHKGSHKNFDKTIKAIVDYSIKNQYDIVGPITEIYIPADPDTPVEETETEVQLPVIYMGPKRD